MSRRNNVRGPSSALTEFLRESGITPTTVARRAQIAQPTEAPVAGPSTAPQQDAEDVDMEDAEAAQMDLNRTTWMSLKSLSTLENAS
ncbi:hypothetical protein FKP32DRAFT_320218 [Trametes sanguinea]|nr:hypothetical protein FKP32DRAFT_320218 [Trametes sanguinea]